MKLSTWLRAEWDRVAGFGLVGLGALFILLGYLGVRNSPFVAEQMAYIASGGIGGLFCLGFGVGLLLTADLHDEWRKLDRLEAELRGDEVPEPEADLAGGSRHALALVSLILLLPLTIAGAGWRRASQTVDLDVAARGLGLAIAAVAAGMVVLALWALWMRTSVLHRRAQVTRALHRSIRTRVNVTPAQNQHAMDDDTIHVDSVFVAEGHRRFPRAGCPTLEWIEATPVPRDRINAGLAACGLCE
ncbi:MAG: hypothetical protein LC792_21055, partial [Actinobacteria bacterium]|nr:hypothetical protein [Actinomycetota bacterium]